MTPPFASRGAIPIPHDPALEGLAALLDGEQLSKAMASALGLTDVVVRPRYVRYKPGNKAIVLSDVRLSGAWTTAVVTLAALKDMSGGGRRRRAIADRARSRCLAPEPIQYLEELKVLVEWYPANRSIPGLVADLSALRDDLERRGIVLGEAEQPALVSYKPERRAVLKWGGAYLKAYVDPTDFQTAASALGTSAGIPGLLTPHPIARYGADRLTVQTELPGSSPSAPPPCSEIGHLLATLHASHIGDLPPFRRSDHVEGARKTLEHLRALVPERQSTLDRIESRIAPSSRPESLVPSHGDFHERQVTATPAGPGLVDFDHMCLAEPAYDLCTFAAHRVRGDPEDLQKTRAAIDDLSLGYGATPAGIDWYLPLAIIRRTPFPFRFLEPDWPARIARMLDVAQSLLV